MDSKDKTPKVVRIFESYGRNDASDIAIRLKDSLEESGYEVWIDREHLRTDDKHFPVALQQAVRQSEVIIALLSPHSVRGQTGGQERSSFCYNELLLADELKLPIVPVRVRKFPGPPPFLIIKYRRVDWLDWEQPDSYRKGLREVTATIKRVLGKESLLNGDIAFQVSNFAPQLRTAIDGFTGREWLFARLDAWLAGAGRCLMIEGDAGSGKTAVVAELVRRNPGGRLLAYHFCTDQLTLDPVNFVKSLAGMLAATVDAYAEQLWNRLAGALAGTDPNTMLREGVLEPLRDVAMEGSYYIVVDALDEAVGVTSAQVSLPRLLAGALPEFPSWLKLVVTSRPHQRIQPLFRGAEHCALTDGSANNQHDLHSFVAHRLAEPTMQHAVEADQCDAAARLIEDRAAGNFQYAGCVLDALASCEMVLAQLDALPHTLENFYYKRAEDRFPDGPDFRLARVVLEVLLAAREPLSVPLLADITGLDRDAELYPALDAVSCFAGPTAADAWRIAHKSIADWFMSADAGRFTVDPGPGRQRILAHCERWAQHHEPYALKHVVTHLLEAGRVDDALNAVQNNLFEQRASQLREPRLDAEDSRNLTAALISARNQKSILALAQTPSTWQRDGVASGLQSAPAEALPFIDGVVAALLTVTA